MSLISLKNGGAVFCSSDETGVNHVRRQPRSDRPGNNTQRSNWSSKDLEKILLKLQSAFDDERAESLASSLGVTVGAVRALCPGWADKTALRKLKAGGYGWLDSPPTGAWVFAERDGHGRLIGLALRTEDGRKGFPRGANRGLIVPSGLAMLPDPILVVEGASDVAACIAFGLAAVGRPSNASGDEHLAEMLRGRSVLIGGENDAKDTGVWPGRDGAVKIAHSLAQRWNQPVSWSLPPNQSNDIRSYLHALVASGVNLNDESSLREAGKKLLADLLAFAIEEQPEKLSVADKILRLAMQNYRLGMSDTHEAFAVPINGPTIAVTLRGNLEVLRAVLAREYRVIYGKTPSTSAMRDAFTVLEGEALEANPELLALRVATLSDHEDEDAVSGPCTSGIVIDLGDSAGRAVIVRPGS